MQFCLPKFLGPLLGAPNTHYFEWLKLGSKCFLISLDNLTDKYCDIVEGYQPPGTPRNQLFEQLKLGCQFFDIIRCLTDLYFAMIWGNHAPKYSQMDTQNSVFRTA